jgi:hypothetical protein
MSRLLAVDWDRHEVRYVVARARAGGLTVEAVGSAPIAADGAGGSLESSLVSALTAAIAPLKLGRVPSLVALERSQIELVNLTLPPASNAELPDLVRNQAMRESGAIGEDACLDFVPLNDDPALPRNVSAVALPQDRLARIQSACNQAGLAAKAITLRPYGTAALFASLPAAGEAPSLLVNVLADEIDLSVVAGGRVVYWRTLRQANVSHDAAAANRLIAEINRTLVVAQAELQDRKIESAFLFGSLSEHPTLVERCTTGLSLPLVLVDPFGPPVKMLAPAPPNPGRYSALVGMLAVEARRGAAAIDFLHPRKTAPPPNRRRTLALAGAAAALLVGLGGYQAWSSLAEIDAQNESLAAELDRLDQQFKRAGKQQRLIEAVKEWGANDVNWLDELRDLSVRFPSDRDAVVLRMGLGHARGEGGTIDMVGVVRDPVIVTRIENSLRDKFHQISSRHVQERVQENNYSWHFESSLVVASRDKKQYLSHLPESDRAEAAAVQRPTPRTAASKR